MSKRIPQSSSELKQHLLEQLGFIRASSASYDSGFEGEAKRLAVSIRILVHDTGRSKSLLSSLGLKSSTRFASVLESPGERVIAYVGLGMGFSSTGLQYHANLDDPVAHLPFDEWWEGPIMIQKVNDVYLTRRDAVLELANTDGGAHVDPDLNAEYQAIYKSNKFGWEVHFDNQGGVVDNGPVLPAVRQIAHEVILTIGNLAK